MSLWHCCLYGVSPVCDDPLHDVISGETVPAVDGPEYPPPPRLLKVEHITYCINATQNQDQMETCMKISLQKLGLLAPSCVKKNNNVTN